MMIPITRKEKYINEIVGGGNTVPETPQTREEIFYAAILGEVVASSPITRAEKYLAKIANKYSGELPEPVTRIERFLARAAGMDVTIPTPITREEMLWANYALIVEKELSGIPPLTFNAIAGTLKNYRIYGNTVNGESVGDLVTDSQSEHYGEYAIPITHNAETANIYLDEPLRKVGDEAEYIDFKEQKQYRVRKNLLKNTATTQTTNNVTFTINQDYSVTCNGRAPKNLTATLLIPCYLYANVTYKLTGTPQNTNGQVQLDMRDASGMLLQPLIYDNTGNGVIFSVNSSGDYKCGFRISPNYNCENITFYPMIRRAEIADGTYEPYIEDTEVDVILSGIAVTAGTNTLTVGTEVQPSNVYIKYEGAR